MAGACDPTPPRVRSTVLICCFSTKIYITAFFEECLDSLAWDLLIWASVCSGGRGVGEGRHSIGGATEPTKPESSEEDGRCT